MYDRSKTIGASDAVMIAEGKWAELYDRKTSPEPPDYPLPARIGHACEAVNREWFMQQTGLQVRYHPGWEEMPLTHPDYPWMKYLPDGLIDINQLTVPWEGKAVNMMWNPDNLIRKYTPQLLHQMMVIGADHAYLSVLYLNTKWDYYRIEYDEPAADHLLEQEKLFLFMLERGIRPPEYQGKRKGWTV